MEFEIRVRFVWSSRGPRVSRQGLSSFCTRAAVAIPMKYSCFRLRHRSLSPRTDFLPTPECTLSIPIKKGTKIGRLTRRTIQSLEYCYCNLQSLTLYLLLTHCIYIIVLTSNIIYIFLALLAFDIAGSAPNGRHIEGRLEGKVLTKHEAWSTREDHTNLTRISNSIALLPGTFGKSQSG